MTNREAESSGFARRSWLRALEATAPIARNPAVTLPTLLAELADRFGDAPALLSERECLSYSALAARANRYARWGLQQDLARGEVVCLLMPNRPEYLAIWLGITRIGGVVALLNTNLRGPALAHSVRIVAAKHAIVAAELAGAWRSAAASLPSDVRVWAHGGASCEWPRVDDAVEALPGDALQSAESPVPSIADRALCIYTSGTTGLPKAANVSHSRVLQWCWWFAGLMDTGPGDRMYNCLPLYHSIGGVVAVGPVLVRGGSVVIRERFSASRFWDEVVGWQCTLFQYIGELCRYLVNSPPDPRDAEHRLRLCCGNGLRKDVWETFQSRFRIPHILEFYAATEGNFSLYNCEGEPGAIGRIPSFLAHRFSIALVKHDDASEQPIRDAQGRCIRCAPGEAGEAIGRISDASGAGAPFEGYTDKEASERKVLRDVFEPGDLWFRTGDLMRRDERGFFYFVDRIGDTFRWKGENVSTTEVAEAICGCPGIVEAVVYGVAVPGTEGRAGMAAIVVDGAFDLTAFRHSVCARLPDYARPLFLRIRDAIETTGTFKPVKRDLAREGCDPQLVTDALYVDDRSRGIFVPLDAALYARLRDGEFRL
ncbi:MAG: long-chain-acyl-CoA synthetase [Alphaproteobacteria bacterium]|nr:long-chain-acyl-CoA synthetase [Alphaproteobacteria bacterium]